MKRISSIIFLMLCVFVSTLLQAQIQNDSTLYLFFDKEIHGKIEHQPRYHIIEKKIVDPENFYWFKGDYNLYGGYPMEFYSINKKKFLRIKKNDIDRFKVLSIDELKIFIQKNYQERRPEEYLQSNPLNYGSYGPDPKGSASYWNNLKHIYFVEKDGKHKNKFVISEVTLKVDIE